MLKITESAKKQIDLMSLANSTLNHHLRIYIVGTGYGIDYQFSYSEYQVDDFEFPTFQSKILVDCVSIHYLEDSTLDYTDDLFNGGFVVKYPKIQIFGNLPI